MWLLFCNGLGVGMWLGEVVSEMMEEVVSVDMSSVCVVMLCRERSVMVGWRLMRLDVLGNVGVG